MLCQNFSNNQFEKPIIVKLANSSLKTGEGNWAEFTFAKTFGNVTRDIENHWNSLSTSLPRRRRNTSSPKNACVGGYLSTSPEWRSQRQLGDAFRLSFLSSRLKSTCKWCNEVILYLQGRDVRRKSIAVKKGSHIGNVTNNEQSCDTVNRLTVCHANEEKESSASRSPSLNRLQAKVSSFTAFTGVHKANQAEKRREVNKVFVIAVNVVFSIKCSHKK